MTRHFLSLVIAFVCFETLHSQNTHSLPRSAPEAQGVSSQAIADFIDAANRSHTEFHSFMLLRHGKVVGEAWWNPYRPDLKHTLYSCSKSFTATAIGFAVQEKLLTLNDKVISFFPNDLPDTVSPFLSELTVKDVLMMSDGQDPDPTTVVPARDTNWIKGFLSTTIVNKPGTKFLYNSLGTYMLSAIIQKVSGQKTIDYLRPRFFTPLGIEGMDWETDRKGINTGGWGLRLKTEDMAKFAQLFLQKGKWNGKQVLPQAWVEEASTMKIMQDPSAPQSKKDSSDWLQGYCYQMWRCRHNAFRGDGAFGQFMIVMPDQDAAIAITAETADMQEEINLVWKYLLPALGNKKLKANRKAYAQLTAREHALELPKPAGSQNGQQAMFNGKTFSFPANDLHLQKMSFNFTGDRCDVNMVTDSGAYPIAFAAEKWQEAETNMAGPSLVGGTNEDRSMIYPANIAAAYAWTNDSTLLLKLRYIESPHSETLTCHLNGADLTIDAERSLDFGHHKMTLVAKAD